MSPCTIRSAQRAAAALLLAIAGSGAAAQGLQGSFNVQGGGSHVSPNGGNVFNVTQFSPVTRGGAITKGTTNSGTSGPGSAGATASADAGLLDLFVQASSTSATGASGLPINGGLMFTSAFASASFTDFIITGPVGATSVQASVNGNLVVMGSLTDNTNSNLALRGVEAIVSVPGGTAFSSGETLQSQAFISPIFTLPVGQAFGLGMQLKIRTQTMIAGSRPAGGGGARAGLSENLSVNASLSLGTTIHGAAAGSLQALAAGDADAIAATTGPVFNLPAGFSVSSMQANIDGNQWLGPTLPVPEPASVWLLLGGGALLALRRRRRG